MALNEHVEHQVVGALRTVVRRKFGHNSWHIDRDDKKEFLKIITCVRVEPTASWSQPTAVVAAHESGKSTLMAEGTWRSSAKVRLGVQANYRIRAYSLKPVRLGAGVGGGVGGVGGAAAGGTGGAVAGVAIGATVGTVVPIVGNIVGGIIGGIVGGIGGVVVGAGTGAAVGTGAGAVASYDDGVNIKAREVFQQLPSFSEDKHNNIVYCILCSNNQADGFYYRLT